MPLKEKILAEDQEFYSISTIDEITPEYMLASAANDVNDVVTRLFAPRSHLAMADHKRRMAGMEARRKWLETIVNNQANLQLTAERLRIMASRQNGGGSGNNGSHGSGR